MSQNGFSYKRLQVHKQFSALDPGPFLVSMAGQTIVVYLNCFLASKKECTQIIKPPNGHNLFDIVSNKQAQGTRRIRAARSLRLF